MGFNNPMPVSLQQETRKAYKIVRSFVDVHNNGLDKVIPRHVLERAHGFAIFTVAKAGFLFSARAGSGIVIAKLDDGTWSPPSAIAIGGLGFGGQAGAEVADFLIVLNSQSAVATFMSAGSITLGGNLSIAVGPLGRNAEGSGSLNTKGRMAAMYSYSKTKGLFGGVSLEGSVIAERQDANRLAYGGNPTAKQILSGAFNPPDWAYILIDELDRATGIPGGHQWVDDKPDDDVTRGMGWSTPTGNGKQVSGYAFGEGVGAGGTTSKSRKRSSSLFSIGGGKDKTPEVTGAVFSARPPAAGSQLSYSDRYNDPIPTRDRSASNGATPIDRAPPNRPWESRRASSYLPAFGKSPQTDRKAGPSSETYNSDQTHRTTQPNGRPAPKRPYDAKPIPSPFSDFGTGSRNSTPVDSPTYSPIMSNSPALANSPSVTGEYEWGKSNGNGVRNGHSAHGSRSSSLNGRARAGSLNGRANGTPPDEMDLLGTWDANDRGLTASFGRMNVRGSGSGSNSPALRSKRSSTMPFESIAEDDHRVRLRETTSNFANKDWVGNAAGTDRRAFSTYGAPEGWPGTGTSVRERDYNPFQEREYDNSRPFEDYTVPQRRSSRSQMSPSSTGLRGPPKMDTQPKFVGNEGYARAVALFDFAGYEKGDLGFKKGQVITILDLAGSEEWWRGRYASDDSREGIFPANYVETLDIPRNLRGGVSKTQLRTRLLTGLEFD